MHKFLLPNKKSVNYDEVIDAMYKGADDRHYYLNVQTGEVELNPKPLANDLHRIPDVTDERRSQWINDLLEILEQEPEDQALIQVRQGVEHGRDFQYLEKIILDDPGLSGAWDVVYGDDLFDEMRSWFDQMPIEIKYQVEWFDDCPICQAMKNGCDSLEELKTAFQEAKNKGAVVGGDLLDEK